MDTATARKRLEEIQAELERSIAVLRGEAEQDERAADYPQDPADAGANLSESERTQAVLHAAEDLIVRAGSVGDGPNEGPSLTLPARLCFRLV